MMTRHHSSAPKALPVMSDAFPWAWVAGGLAAALTMALLVMLVLKVVSILIGWRDELRDRYTRGRFEPEAADLIAMPLWLTLEVVCFAVSLVLGLIMLLLAYQVAKDARDWWHAGSRGRR